MIRVVWVRNICFCHFGMLWNRAGKVGLTIASNLVSRDSSESDEEDGAWEDNDAVRNLLGRRGVGMLGRIPVAGIVDGGRKEFFLLGVSKKGRYRQV